jgi:hypothetical protein
MPKYENAVVYKLCCDDPEITDIYVGSTCNFKVRKWSHKTSCTNKNDEKYNSYVYRFIREHGGWDAWSMILVKKYPHVADNQELLMKERKWITRLKATLNKRVPGAFLELGKTEYHRQDKVIEYKKQWGKQYRIKNKEHLTEKIKCDCGCMIRRSNLVRHKNSKKHKEYMSNE